MRAVAGLGNPGDGYAATRHNAGWMLLDRLGDRGRSVERRDKEFVELERLTLGPDAIWLMRPKTYMNRSGLGIEQGCRVLGLEPADVLVAYDDVDLPLGQLRLRRSGGAGGHRGVESVLAELQTQRVPRLRLGVRGPRPWRDTADYVLADFEPDEIDTLNDMLKRATAAVRTILRRGFGAAMNTTNRKPDDDGRNEPDQEP